MKQSAILNLIMTANLEINAKIKDEGRLAELGYAQELERSWGFLHNFGASYSIIVRNSRCACLMLHKASYSWTTVTN